jgi:Tfp pilus assembly protein PilX
MKLNRNSSRRRSNERGFFLVVVMLILATIMLVYLAANSGHLMALRKEIKLMDQKQVERLNRSSAVSTNTVSTPPPASPQ